MRARLRDRGADVIGPARGVPASFTTGYDGTTIPPELADMIRLEKPVNLTALCRAVETAVFAAPRRQSAPVVDQ